MTLPFGRHKGRDISAVPLEYLLWLRNQTWLSDYLKITIDSELEVRRQFDVLRRVGQHRGGLAVEPSEIGLLRMVLDLGSRAVKLRSHPGTIKRLDRLTAKLRIQLDVIEQGKAA